MMFQGKLIMKYIGSYEKTAMYVQLYEIESCIFKAQILDNKKCVRGHEQKSNTIYTGVA